MGDFFLPGDIEDENGAPLSDQLAEHRLLAAMVAHPEICDEVRSLVSSREFFDRTAGRIFDGICSLEGFEPTVDHFIGWVGEFEIGGRSPKQFLGYLRGLGASLPIENASGDAEAIFEAAERRFTRDGQTNLVGLDAFQSKMGLLMWRERNSFGAVDTYEFLVEDTIPEQELSIIMGETQAGKSFLAYHLAMCLARGLPFFGRRILKPVPVIWCCFEGGKGARGRMLAYGKHHGIDVDDIKFAALTSPVDLWSKDLNVEELIKEIEGIIATEFDGQTPGAIIIDTHNAATPGASEIDSEAVSKIRDRYRRIVAAVRAAVIIIGHTNALGKHRGSELLVNNVDTVITVKLKTVVRDRVANQVKDNDNRDVRVATLVKQREGVTGHLFDFVLPAVETGIKNKFGKSRTSCVVVAPNWSEQEAAEANVSGKKSETKAGFKLTDIEDHFFRVLWKELQTRGQPAPAELALPIGTKVVNRADVSKAFKDSSIPEDGSLAVNPNTVKTRWTRATSRLRKFQVIGFKEPHFWWTGKPILGRPETLPQRSLFETSPDGREFPSDDEFPADA